jgi:hypothetical protein
MTRLLLRLYPAAWRNRYGEELLELVAETGLTPRVAADLVRSGLRERARAAKASLVGGVSMALGPAWRHPTAWAIAGLIALLPVAFVLAASIALPYQIARAGLDGFVNSLQSWLNTNRLADLLLITLPAVAAFCAGVPLVRLGMTRAGGSSEVSLSVRLRVVNVAVVLLALAIGGLLVGHIVFESVMQIGA